MIWATVSSWSCFCWLYRASPSLAAKNIINLISVLAIWWCPRVESSLLLLEEGVCYDQCVLLAKLYYSKTLCPASFCTPRPCVFITGCSKHHWLSKLLRKFHWESAIFSLPVFMIGKAMVISICGPDWGFSGLQGANCLHFVLLCKGLINNSVGPFGSI